ncbi:uncharacterized protein LOC111055375 isoform X2 [Nilaparvata lugens]|uniref:uncharacterized protein LOC111055375 isoform X2 n=1 Tax=Nilaparvata lugens TaxID=108931 RepID=UPI00193DE975|nr:uncharacterized protein LOC111055375 isoform X2 [Nilaparvata lugens]
MSLPNLLFLSLICCFLISVPSIFAEDEDDNPQEEELPEVEAPWSDENDAMCTCCDPPVRRGDVITDENELQAKYMKMKPIEFSIIWLLRFFGLKMEPGHIRYSKWLKKSRKLNNDDLLNEMVYDVSKQIHYKSPQQQKEPKDDEAQDSEEEGISSNTTVLPPTVVEHARKTANIRKRVDANGNPKRLMIKGKILAARGVIKVLDTFLPDAYLVDDPMDKATKALDIVEYCIKTTTVTDPEEEKNKCAFSFYVAQCILSHENFEGIRQYIFKVRQRNEEARKKQRKREEEMTMKEGEASKHEEEEEGGMREKETKP